MTVRRQSALSAISVAIVAAIAGDDVLGDVLAGAKVYNQVAPPKSPFPYCTLDFATETADNEFNALGTNARRQISWWGRRELVLGDTEMLAIWNGLYGLLHEQPLSLDGFRMVIGTLELIGILPDPDGETLHGIAQYSVISRQQ